MSNKCALRKEFIERRKSIQDKKLKSEKIAKNLISLPCFSQSHKIAIYYSLPQEAETTGLIEYMLKQNKEVYLPKVLSGTDMEFYRIASLNEVKEVNGLGIHEPNVNEKNRLDKSSLDLIIVPGVCFDESLNRIGFSGGYYDRYLENAERVVKVAICFDEQVLKGKSIDADRHDIKMDMIVTEKTIYT